MKEISVTELKELKDKNENFVLLDVREQYEYDICNLNGKLIPLSQLAKRFNELNPEAHIIIHCRSGGRSRQAGLFLEQEGFKNISNLTGGILAWAKEIDPSIKQY